jgi:hypothetical protein
MPLELEPLDAGTFAMLVLRIPSILGLVLFAFNIGFGLYVIAEWLLFRNASHELSRLHGLPSGQAHGVLYLPLASAASAVVASLGVNLVSAGKGQDLAVIGVFLVVIGVIFLFGFCVRLVMSFSERPSGTRRIRRRLNIVSNAIDDPLASEERLIKLLPEISRYGQVGSRIASIGAATSFRAWMRRWLRVREVLVVVFLSEVAAIVFFVLRLSRVGWAMVDEWLPYLMLGVVSGVLAPIQAWCNYRNRCRGVGAELARESLQVVRKLRRVESARNLVQAIDEPASRRIVPIAQRLRLAWQILMGGAEHK